MHEFGESTSVNAQSGTSNLRRKGGLHLLGAFGQIGHQEGWSDQVALAIAEVDPPESPAGFAGSVGVLHAVAPPDLGREQLGRSLDVPVQELPELVRVLCWEQGYWTAP